MSNSIKSKEGYVYYLIFGTVNDMHLYRTTDESLKGPVERILLKENKWWFLCGMTTGNCKPGVFNKWAENIWNEAAETEKIEYYE